MYAETGTAMREACAALLRQHRVQQRLGATTTERTEHAQQILRYRHTVLVWSHQTLVSISPLMFSNQAPALANPFCAVGVAGRSGSPTAELARALDLTARDTGTRPASLEEITTPTGQPASAPVELWRTAARAAILAEHDTAPNVTATMTVSQAHAVAADIAAITQALVVLDQRYVHNTPAWQPLTQGARLGWAALAVAIDINLGQPDYTVDTLGWRPRAKPIAGPARPGIRGVLQAEHNLLVRTRAVPSATNLRYIVDSQRLLTRHLLPFAARTAPRLTARWTTRAKTYTTLQRHLRSIASLTGQGGLTAAEGANAVSRIRALPADTIVDPRTLAAFQMLFDRLDDRIADIIDNGIDTGLLVQRTRLPRLDNTSSSGHGPIATVRERAIPLDRTTNRDLTDTVHHLRPRPNSQVTTPGPSRADLHTALLHRPPTRGATSDVPGL